ncbi:QcrA and Rieske domain-containing protein [Geotalea uraniireducens]|uniref:Rieske (2Fe-2S) domain protein n=1 Tax=Geotalea uraniireducens (strain Rf4) TaxID=351605 RepID=A5G440_GEOUR|nr:ubiquinol-cytochrome c reductase iron-sulfur subunit [Geotalea uraniireducens]ABQ26558.1 Rieske (2Fe-2S) domain protein [Geotalea uraniireducens Rf4]
MVVKERRTFLGVCLGALFAAGAGAIAYPVFRYLAPRREIGNKGKVEIPESELTAGSAKYFEYQGKAAVLIRKKSGALLALSAVCTHLGCVVQWQKENEQFLCPCHAGLFTADGTVISGPPPKPLEKISFVIANGIIIVG